MDGVIEPKSIDRQQISSALMLFGGVILVVGVFLPWAKTQGVTLAGLSSQMTNFSIAFFVIGLLSVIATVFNLRKATMAKRLAILLIVSDSFVSLIFPAGVTLGVNDLAKLPTNNSTSISFQVGAWIVSFGLVTIVVGAMTLCTTRRSTTIIAMLIPLVLSTLLIIAFH